MTTPALATAPSIDDAPLALARFEALATEHPDELALACGDERLTYGELLDLTTELARDLVARGIGADDIVAVRLPRRPAVVVAILGVLRAGAAYLPIDPAHPRERTEMILEDARAKLLLTTEGFEREGAASGPEILVWHERATRSRRFGREAAPLPTPARDDLAYLMYTSGSTGKPKGVMIEHRSLAAFVDWAVNSFARHELSAVLASTSLAFDISVFELLAPLSTGGSIVLVDNLFSLDDSAAQGVTLINTVPSVMSAALKHGELPSTVESCVLAGEPLAPELVSELVDRQGARRVVNAYGPTEDTIYSTWTEVPAGARVPIGKPLPGTAAYVLDEELHEVPDGEPGELHLSGVGLARGYHDREDLTEQRFVPDTIARTGRMYKTGDLVVRENGVIYHLGRIDDQIKIRGVRIEPGEIESALRDFPNIDQAAVVARERTPGEKQLVAYVTSAEEFDRRELRGALRRKLPATLVPSVIVRVDEMPLNPNGKLDRKRLPDPFVRVSSSTPLTDRERRLAGLWQEVLELPAPPGPSDDFFELGGDSLAGMRLFDRIVDEFDCELPPHVMVESSTVASLTERIDSEVGHVGRLVELNRKGRRPPCVYLGAGGMFSLRAFAAESGAAQPFIGIQALNDRESSGDGDLGVVETARECLMLLRRVQPGGPYYIIGHSIGGHIAFEMACELQRQHEEVPFLALFDSSAPQTLRWHGRLLARGREISGRGPDARGLTLVRAALGSARNEALDRATRGDDARQRTDWIKTLADLERAYRPPQFRGDVVIFNTLDTTRFTGSRSLGWARYIDGRVETVRVPGAHLSMLLDPHVGVLARELSTRLAAAQDR